MSTDKIRFLLYVDDDTYKGISDYRYKNRYASRNAAICDLINAGLKAKAGEIDTTEKPIERRERNEEGTLHS